uniref:Uncharacterized protein n=1 Tax=Ceratitis capitata TaxID=7213 RepID=W8BCS7_CERCA
MYIFFFVKKMLSLLKIIMLPSDFGKWNAKYRDFQEVVIFLYSKMNEFRDKCSIVYFNVNEEDMPLTIEINISKQHLQGCILFMKFHISQIAKQLIYALNNSDLESTLA